ncbi:MAG: hypothetical protein V7641_853 [Blastocatellia bacterium]
MVARTIEEMQNLMGNDSITMVLTKYSFRIESSTHSDCIFLNPASRPNIAKPVEDVGVRRMTVQINLEEYMVISDGFVMFVFLEINIISVSSPVQKRPEDSLIEKVCRTTRLVSEERINSISRYSLHKAAYPNE